MIKMPYTLLTLYRIRSDGTEIVGPFHARIHTQSDNASVKETIAKAMKLGVGTDFTMYLHNVEPRAPITVNAALEERDYAVEVADEGKGTPRHAVSEQPLSRNDGFALQIVISLANPLVYDCLRLLTYWYSLRSCSTSKPRRFVPRKDRCPAFASNCRHISTPFAFF